MKIYAFDVDETLEISNGPVTLQSMMDLRSEGHVVGICGNWALFCQRVKDWQNLASFLNVGVPKSNFLYELKVYIPAEEYVLVGNVFGETNSLGFKCGSYDSHAAVLADWRFIKEDDFARGTR